MSLPNSPTNTTALETPKKPDFLSHPLVRVALLAAALFVALTFADKPTFWLPMLSTYIIASGVYFWQKYKDKSDQTSLLHFLFPKDMWLHPSTVQDCLMTFISWFLMTKVLYLIVIDPHIFTAIGHWILSALSIEQGTGSTPPQTVIALYVVLSIMAADLFYYISHRMTHEIPALWEFHKAHHSAETLTPLVVYRLHPVDAWFNQCCRNIGAGIVAGFFFYFYPSSESLFIITATNAGLFTFHLFLANLRHSHIWISFGQTLEHVLISPVLHQIHHSTAPKHFNKNYGSMLSVWDWMFGSLYIPKERETLTFGLGSGKAAEEQKSLLKMYLYPLGRFVKWVVG